MGWLAKIVEKFNPAQVTIVRDTGTTDYSNAPVNIEEAYNTIEVINRGVDYLVDSSSTIPIDVGDKINTLGVVSKPIRKNTLSTLINYKPNDYQNSDAFKRNIFLDLILEGNAFIYWDGKNLYNLPAKHMEIVKSKKTFVKGYMYNSEIPFTPLEIIHVKDNSSSSIYRGSSRLLSATDSIKILNNMFNFHSTFFKNGTVPGLILKTPNVLTKKIKGRIKEEWMQEYNPRTGGRRPLILDGDFTLDTLGTKDLRELDFSESVKIYEEKVLKAIGVPLALIAGGNNANIAPNVRLFYTGTVLPLTQKYISALEFFFGYDLKMVTQEVPALKPDLKEEANWFSTLTNAGIITRNEARAKLRLPKSDSSIADELILPANVAGSAVNQTTGGRPPKQ